MPTESSAEEVVVLSETLRTWRTGKTACLNRKLNPAVSEPKHPQQNLSHLISKVPHRH